MRTYDADCDVNLDEIMAAKSGDVIDFRKQAGSVKTQRNVEEHWAFCICDIYKVKYTLQYGHSIELSPQNLIKSINEYISKREGAIFDIQTQPENALKTIFKYIQDYGMPEDPASTSKLTLFKKKIPTGWVRITMHGHESSEVNLISALESGAMVAVMEICPEFDRYARGVYEDQHCQERVTRIVIIIGYGEDKQLGKYWLIKNSRGPEWGEQGYMRIARGRNTDGITKSVFYLDIYDHII